MMRKNSAVLIVALLTPTLVGADDRHWGPVVDGLQMSIACSPPLIDNARLIQITVRNVGDEDVLGCFGPIIGKQTHPTAFQVDLQIANEQKTVILTGPAGVAGAVAALATPLIRQSAYMVQMPAKEFYVLEDHQTLADDVAGGKPFELAVKWDGTATSTLCKSLTGQHELPYWNGVLVSNRLRTS